MRRLAGSALRRVLQHWRIAGQFARIGVVRKSQFRLDFAFQVVMDVVWYATHVLVFEVLFRHAGDIAGWTKPEVRVFLGFLFVSDAFMMIWLGQGWRFGRDLKDGKLDPVRVRPASAIFLYFFQQFSLEATLNMAVALGYLAFAIVAAGLPLGALTVPALAFALVLAFWARTVTMVMFTLFEFYLLNSDLGNFFHHFVEAAADKPVDVYPRRIQILLLHLVPVGAMTQVPAAMVLGRTAAAPALLGAAGLVTLGLAVFWFWRRSFRRYESALG